MDKIEDEVIPPKIVATQQDVINVIKSIKDKYASKGIIFDEKLITTIYTLCKYYFIDGYDYVVLQAPTGSGKSIISFVFSECVAKLLEMIAQRGDASFDGKPSYYLTSSKALQDQISEDLQRFQITGNRILKGVDNYRCLFEHDKTYKNRACNGYSGEETAEKFWCADKCPYRIARSDASVASTATLNYHYFLNVMRTDFKPFFDKRFMTICDEAHKLDSIIDDMFTSKITPYQIKEIKEIIETLKINRYFIEDGELSFKLADAEEMFFNEKTAKEDILYKYGVLITFYKQKFQKAHAYYKKNPANHEHINDDLNKIIERLISTESVITYFKNVYEKRREDIFIRTSVWGNYKDSKGRNKFNFELKDLGQTQNIQSNFVSKCYKILMMSATIGDYYELINLFGFDEEKSKYIKLPNTFDFSNSPIYITNSGSLTHKNYDKNVFGCIEDVATILKKLHPNDKGIIHTHTFGIKELLEARCISDEDLRKRVLFYTDAQSKKIVLETLKNEDFPYVIAGPSLTEGIDLRDDFGRFNILIKVPYPYLDSYAQRMIKRCSFWYSRKTKNEIVQAIGRTNRNKNDFSDVYLIDSKFRDIIVELDDTIVGRLKQLQLPEREDPNKKVTIHQTPPKPTDGMDSMIDDALSDSDFIDDLPF